MNESATPNCDSPCAANVTKILYYRFGKNLNAFKPSEHPPSVEKLSKDLGGKIGCRYKNLS